MGIMELQVLKVIVWTLFQSIKQDCDRPKGRYSEKKTKFEKREKKRKKKF